MRESRDSEAVDLTRSRRAFRWMPSAVLSHNMPVQAENPNTVGRNLFARKLRETSEPPARRDVLQWQVPYAYLVITHRAGWLFTWHAPWCRRCDCPGAGWRFVFEYGYWSAFGFELSFPRQLER